MASLVAEADTWTNTMTVPDDGDTRNAASVTAAGVGFQVAADRTRFLYNRSLAAKGGTVLIPMVPLVNVNARFTYDHTGAGRWSWVQTSVADNGPIIFPIPQVAIDVNLTHVQAVVDGDYGGAGGHVALPASLPSFNVYEFNYSTQAVTSIGNGTDPSAALAAYELTHSIPASPLAVSSPSAVDGSNQLILQFNGESGANSKASELALLALLVTYAPA